VLVHVSVCVCVCGETGQLVSECRLDSLPQPLSRKGVTSISQTPRLVEEGAPF
jgi:hypothetical protein